jgi:septum formation protein
MLVLASASPRRRELLAQAGYTFTVAPASIPEDLRAGENPIAYVTRLAREKAQFVYSGVDRDAVVLGADTTVVSPHGSVLGKPADVADAARMLRLLSGQTHQVITGVAIVNGDVLEIASEVTHVSVLTLSEEEIATYIATGEPMDKAGAYAIQGYAARWIPRIHGCYFNVVGLPLALVSGMLEGVFARQETRQAVQRGT